MTTLEQPATDIGTTQVYRVYIRATPQQIWDAITQPEWTDKYGYGGRAEYELKPGGRYIGHSSEMMRASGAPDTAVDGEVLEMDPPYKLVQTWRMLMGDGLREEGFTKLTYEIEERNHGITSLTVTHDLGTTQLLPQLTSGAWEKQGAGGGWNWVLSSLKTLLETGEGLPWQG